MCAPQTRQSRPFNEQCTHHMCVRVFVICLRPMHKNYILQDISVKIDIKINVATGTTTTTMATTLKGHTRSVVKRPGVCIVSVDINIKFDGRPYAAVVVLLLVFRCRSCRILSTLVFMS